MTNAFSQITLCNDLYLGGFPVKGGAP